MANDENHLSLEQRRELIQIARKTLENHLEGQSVGDILTQDKKLQKKQGVFVSIYVDGVLRGCIGDISGTEPLYQGIQSKAVAAATADTRFQPISKSDWEHLSVGISVLSPLKKVTDPDEIIIGKHGVIVAGARGSGVFLPQVAEKTGWDKERFMAELCTQKAGLPPEAWKDPATDLYIFTAEEFNEEDVN